MGAFWLFCSKTGMRLTLENPFGKNKTVETLTPGWTHRYCTQTDTYWRHVHIFMNLNTHNMYVTKAGFYLRTVVCQRWMSPHMAENNTLHVTEASKSTCK